MRCFTRLTSQAALSLAVIAWQVNGHASWASEQNPKSTPPQARSTKIVSFVVYTRTIFGSEIDHRNISSLITASAEKYKESHDLYCPSPVPIPLDRSTSCEAILKKINDKRDIIDAHTTLVFYYKGHGGVDAQTGDHLLFLDSFDPFNNRTSETWKKSVLERKRLLQALRATKARLVILLTDTCSVPVAGRPPAIGALAGAQTALFEQLFLFPSGTADITSSTYRDPQTKAVLGEASWSRENGALFTSAFVNLYSEEGRKRAEDKGEPVSWNDFFAKVQHRTKDDYRVYQKELLQDETLLPPLSPKERSMLEYQRDQTPIYFGDLPKIPMKQ